MASDSKAAHGQIKATRLSLEIVDEIRKRDEAGVTELADHFGHSKSTIHEHLKTLVNAGYLRNENGSYSLSLRFLLLGGHSRRKEELYHQGKDEVDELAEDTGESSKLVVEENGKGVYLYQTRGDRAVTTDSHIGTRVYLHTTAVGKAIFAHLPAERRKEVIDRHGLPAVTSNTVTDRDELESRLARVRDHGVAFDDEERIEGMRCVAAPIHHDGEIQGAISVSGPKKRIDDERFRTDLPELVKNTVRIIEINSKYSQ